MKHGFIKVAAVTPEVKVADVEYNTAQIRFWMKKAEKEGARIVVFPELCITGYTCGELFLQQSLLEAAKNAMFELAEYTAKLQGIYFVGLPLTVNHTLYNVAAALSGGQVLGIVPKSYLPNYAEFYEGRYFSSGKELERVLEDEIPVSPHLLFCAEGMENVKIAAEICEDLWVVEPPSVEHVKAGATIIVNLSASNAVAGKSDYRRKLVSAQSSKLGCGYIYASAGEGESTMDVVYSGHNLLAENGALLNESELFSTGLTMTEFDVDCISYERMRKNTYETEPTECYEECRFSLKQRETELTRPVSPSPFVPAPGEGRKERCEEIFQIQVQGLKKRLLHTGCKCAVIGISGGLDSTLALLVTVKAFDLLKLDRSGILAVTMPGFGTTDRTYDNAVSMVHSLGATLKEIPIRDAVRQHFQDIGQDESVHDATYENSQARERTQILMDLANKNNGMVIGTGDMSELALGWATYNGDHMSMYGVNVSVPKTMVRHLVGYYADICEDEALQKVLADVLDTPVSPELLPPEDGQIAQKTEDLVGPYELHDFVLYYTLRFGFTPSKIYRLAKIAFDGVYENEVILKWMEIFYRRFFAQQFKRSCLPDGPKVGSVAVSPRGDLRIPSDACGALWLEEVKKLKSAEVR